MAKVIIGVLVLALAVVGARTTVLAVMSGDCSQARAFSDPAVGLAGEGAVTYSEDGRFGMPASQVRSPNDQRSDALNPNSSEYKAAMDNRSNQLNPNNAAYWQSRSQ